MAIVNGYITRDEFKLLMGINDSFDDEYIDLSINAASRSVDNYTGTVFYESATAATAKYYTPPSVARVYIDDAISITSVEIDADGDRTYETTLAPTDYDQMPLNDTPKTWLQIAPQGDYWLPANDPKSVKVTAIWGYAATAPGPVKEATLILAIRLFKRKDAPFGMMGSPELGAIKAIPALDPDVKTLLTPYTRLV